MCGSGRFRNCNEGNVLVQKGFCSCKVYISIYIYTLEHFSYSEQQQQQVAEAQQESVQFKYYRELGLLFRLFAKATRNVCVVVCFFVINPQNHPGVSQRERTSFSPTNSRIFLRHKSDSSTLCADRTFQIIALLF